MAGNKVNTKTKGKEDKGKLNKGVNQSNEDVEDLDFALLRKPIHTSVTGFAQARKIFDLATEELKDVLSNECDLLYECKVCRNIFRSLANLISHKRVYCKEKFNVLVHGHFIKSASTVEEIIKIKRTESGYQDALRNKNERSMDADEVDRIPLSKDLTAVVENIIKTKGIDDSNEQTQVVLQKIPSSMVAVFQNVNSMEDPKDNMRAQVNEIDDILSRDKAVLQNDGRFKIEGTDMADADNVIQISDDDENDADSLKCKICDTQFSTQKTLRFHMKYKHLESRLVYPCPDCLEIFSTSWSVYRHLFKVHRKTAAQIRRLRESIQAKAFRMNNPPAFYEKRKNNVKTAVAQKITEEERLEQENQAWMDNMEGDGEVPRCGGCGRTFERRAALTAHTQTCQPRCRALQPPRRPDAKRIEIQIRKDYNKGPAVAGSLVKDSNEKVTSEDTQPVTKTQNESEKANEVEEKQDQTPMEIEEDQKSIDSAESPEKTEVVAHEVKLPIGLPYALQTEKSNLAAFRQRIQPDIELYKLICKKCDLKLNTIAQLYDHMADHFKWMRYACKLCNYKHYKFEKLPEHVKVVHKLKGDADFYVSTVKAIDGTEAMLLSKCLVEDSTNETNDADDTSPESRRASRCSSDSSRLSDDSSSSSTPKETGSRKRKMGPKKSFAKRKKEPDSKDTGEDLKDCDVSVDKVMKVNLGEEPSNVKSFEENSSDMDDIDDKIPKRIVGIGNSSSVASRRPVRKRTKPKNEDFEYDLSNLLKMEAQGYRDSQSIASTKTTQVKKKQQENVSPEIDVKDYCGALVILSRKAVENNRAHMKNSFFPVVREVRSSDIFIRPPIPRILYRGDKVSPKKDVSDDSKDSSPSKVSKPPDLTNSKDLKTKISEESDKIEKITDEVTLTKIDKKVDSDNAKTLAITNNGDSEECSNMFKIEDVKTLISNEDNSISNASDSSKDLKASDISNSQVKNLKIPAVVPIKFRRQSLDLMKNPIINKNITDFTKAGMKTKILVIKPIRNKDGTRTVNASLKYQTIKLKDPKGSTSSDDNSSDQVVVVKVPKVDRTISRPVTETNNGKTEQTGVTININTSSNKETIENKNEANEVSKTVSEETKIDQVDQKCYSVSETSDNTYLENVSDTNKESVAKADNVVNSETNDPSSIDK